MNEKKCTLNLKYYINNNKYKSFKKRKVNKTNILNRIYDFKKNNFKNKSIFIFGKNWILLLTIITFLLFPLCLSKQEKIRKLISYSEITITINGTGDQKILSESIIEKDGKNHSFQMLPDEILINGKPIENIDNRTVYNLSEEINNVTMKWNSNITNCNCMFSDLSNIISIDFSKFDTSQVTSMIYMFYKCYSLKSLDLTNFKTELVEDMCSMFKECTSLEILNLNFKAPLVVDLSHMFEFCYKLKSIDLSNFEASSAQFLGLMFSNCNDLYKVNFTNFKAINAKYLNNLFYGCNSLESIDLNDFTSAAFDMGNMFSGCTSLKFLDLSSFDLSHAITMGHMFYRCFSLKSINFGETKPNSLVYMDYMFFECYLLESLDLSNFDIKSVSSMTHMFHGCYSLTSLELGIFNTSFVKDMNNIFYNCSSLSSLNLNNFYTLLISNDKHEHMFDNCTNLHYCINDEIISNNTKLQLYSYVKKNCSDLCLINSNKYIIEKNKCINSCLNDDLYQNEYKNICYLSCPNGTKNIENSNLCKPLCEKYYNYQQTECIDEIPLGYYLNDSKLKTIDKCDIKCNNCTLESSLENLCISCNINESYYPKFNDSLNKDNFINCYNQPPEGYYLDINNRMYILEIDNTNNLDSIENINNSDFNNYSDGKYKTDINKVKDEFYSYNEETKVSHFSYEINSDFNELNKIYTNTTIIDFNQDIINHILNHYNLNNENDEIYLVINDYPSNNSKLATSDYDFKFILKNGSELNLTDIKLDLYVDVFVPIRNLIFAHYNYFEYFDNQGFDIYDKNSNFYNDICLSSFLYNNDLTLNDRKLEIYPNEVNLCKANCEYKGINKNNKKIICYCNLKVNNNNDYSKNEDNNFVINKNEIFFDYLINSFNFKIFKCYNLIFDLNKTKTNAAFYLMITSLLALLFIIIKFYSYDFLRIKFLLIKEIKIKKRKRIIRIKRRKSKTLALQKISSKEIFPNNYKKIKLNNLIYNKNSISSTNSKNDINFINKRRSENRNTTKRKGQIDFKRLKDINNNDEKKEDFDELPFTLAVIKDKRDILKIIGSLCLKKISLINLFYGEAKIKILLLNELLLSLILDLFFNALLFSDEAISNKFHNDGKLDFFITLILSLLSNIISSIASYFLNNSSIIEERIDQILENKKSNYYQKMVYSFMNRLALKIFINITIEILVILVCFYYLIIFFSLYSFSVISLLFNFMSSSIEKVIEVLFFSIIFAITRKLSFIFENKYFYNISKFINDKL